MPVPFALVLSGDGIVLESVTFVASSGAPPARRADTLCCERGDSSPSVPPLGWEHRVFRGDCMAQLF